MRRVGQSSSKTFEETEHVLLSGSLMLQVDPDKKLEIEEVRTFSTELHANYI